MTFENNPKNDHELSEHQRETSSGENEKSIDGKMLQQALETLVHQVGGREEALNQAWEKKLQGPRAQTEGVSAEKLESAQHALEAGAAEIDAETHGLKEVFFDKVREITKALVVSGALGANAEQVLAEADLYIGTEHGYEQPAESGGYVIRGNESDAARFLDEQRKTLRRYGVSTPEIGRPLTPEEEGAVYMQMMEQQAHGQHPSGPGVNERSDGLTPGERAEQNNPYNHQ